MSSVLVVDDDADLREALEDVLREAGYEVLTAANGRQALEVLSRTRPSLVLLDMMMPVLDGAGFLRERGASAYPDGVQVPVVVFSASAGGREESERLGAQGYLRKPVDVDELLEAVGRHARP